MWQNFSRKFDVNSNAGGGAGSQAEHAEAAAGGAAGAGAGSQQPPAQAAGQGNEGALEAARVAKWIENLKKDPAARERVVQELAGEQLGEVAGLKKQLLDQGLGFARYKVMAKYGIAEDHWGAGLLTGTTEAELEAQAKAISERDKKDAAAAGGQQGGGATRPTVDQVPTYDPKSGISETEFYKRQFEDAVRAGQQG